MLQSDTCSIGFDVFSASSFIRCCSSACWSTPILPRNCYFGCSDLRRIAEEERLPIMRTIRIKVISPIRPGGHSVPSIFIPETWALCARPAEYHPQCVVPLEFEDTGVNAGLPRGPRSPPVDNPFAMRSCSREVKFRYRYDLRLGVFESSVETSF